MGNGKRALGFMAMYVIATVRGFATYILIGDWAMRLTELTVMPVVCIGIVYLSLAMAKVDRHKVRNEAIAIMRVWILLAVTLDALLYIAIVPRLLHVRPRWTFFIDESPFIWLSYGTMLASIAIASWLYVRRSRPVSSVTLS